MRRRTGFVCILTAVIVLVSPGLGHAGSERTYTYVAQWNPGVLPGAFAEPYGDVIVNGGIFVAAAGSVVTIKIDDHAVPTGRTVPLLFRRQSGSYFFKCVADGSAKSFAGLKARERLYIRVGNEIPTLPLGCDFGATAGKVTISF